MEDLGYTILKFKRGRRMVEVPVQYQAWENNGQLSVDIFDCRNDHDVSVSEVETKLIEKLTAEREEVYA